MATKEKTQNPPAEDQETPDYVTSGDLDAKINAAIKGHLTRFGKDLNKTIADSIAGALASKAEAEATEPKGEDKTAKEIKLLQEKLDKAEKARLDSEKAREETEARRAREEESAAVATAIRDAGITDPVQAEAAQALLERKGRVVRTEAGAIAFKNVDKYGNEAHVGVAEGVKGWATSEGKVFLPPAKVQGAGQKAGNGGGPRVPTQAKVGGGNGDEDAKRAHAGQVLVAALLGGPDPDATA